MSKPLTRTQANLILLIAACAWGCAFVPQSIVAPFIGPITFTAARFLLGAAVIAPWSGWSGKVYVYTKPMMTTLRRQSPLAIGRTSA